MAGYAPKSRISATNCRCPWSWGTAFADLCIKPVRESFEPFTVADLVSKLGDSSDDVGSGKADVFFDRTIEEEGYLGDDAHVSPQGGRSNWRMSMSSRSS